MSKSFNDKKTYLKLLNKYADNCNILIDENKDLKKEIKDLRSNIKINKEIIDSFFSNSKDKFLQSAFKLKEESKALYSQCEALANERNILIQQEQTYTESLSRIKEENTINQTKIFLLEQEVIKKNNSIEFYKKKMYASFDADDPMNIREVYIMEPSKAIVQINDELLLYKQIYQKLIKGILKNQSTIKKNDILITDLQNENSKLKNKFRLQVLASNREKNTMKSFISQHTRNNTNNTNKANNSSNSHNNPCKSFNTTLFAEEYKMKMKLRLGVGSGSNNNNSNNINESIPVTKQMNDNDDFVDVLRHCGLSLNDFEKMSKNKIYSKLTEAIEMLFKSIQDNNITLRLLETEIDNLNMKNFQLNKENIDIAIENNKLKNELQRNKQDQNDINNHTYYNDNSDMTSDYTAGRSSLTIMNYQKLIEKQQKEQHYGNVDMDIALSSSGRKEKNKDQGKELNNQSGISCSNSSENNDDDKEREKRDREFCYPITKTMKNEEKNMIDSKILEENGNCFTINSFNQDQQQQHNSISNSISSSDFRKGVCANMNVIAHTKDSNGGSKSLNSAVFEDIQIIKPNHDV